MIVKFASKEFEVIRRLPDIVRRHKRGSVMKEVIYEINCVACGKPKSIRVDHLIAGKALRHLNCIAINANKSISSQRLTVVCRFINARRDDNKRRHKVLFELTVDEVDSLIFSNCHYCGIEPLQQLPNTTLKYNGIDRVDSDKSYTISNCVPCCGACNRAKYTLSEDEFRKWLDRIARFNGYTK